MSMLKNVKVTPRGREEIVKLIVGHDLYFRQSAVVSGVDPKTFRRWVKRDEATPDATFFVRSNRQARSPHC